MSLILDRLTVRAHYGAAKVREISALASPALNRLIAAKRITETAGLLEHSYNFIRSMRANIETIKSVEKHLEFLEDRGAIKVDDCGTVYVSTLPVDFGAMGKGALDTDFTALNLILDARRSAEDFCPLVHLPPIAARFTEIFKESPDVSKEGARFSRFQGLVRRNLRHPILSFFTARELAAGHALFDANIIAAAGARRDWTKRSPSAGERIALIEKTMLEVKSIPQREINRHFDEDLPPGASPAEKPKLMIVVSDLHIGSQSFMDEKEFLRLCYLAEKLGARLVINGDTFDMAEYKFNLGSAVRNNRRILAAVARLNGILIRGNHDDKLGTFMLRKNGQTTIIFSSRENLFENGVYIEHGHQAGKFFRHGYWKALYQPISFLEKKLGHKFLRWAELLQRELYNIGSWFKNLFRDRSNKANLWVETKISSILNRIRDIYHVLQNKVYILGHEHFAGVAATQKEVVRGVRSDREIGNDVVKAYFSGGWKGREGYAGDFLVVDYSEEGNPRVYPFIWEYTHDPVIVFKKAA